MPIAADSILQIYNYILKANTSNCIFYNLSRKPIRNIVRKKILERVATMASGVQTRFHFKRYLIVTDSVKDGRKHPERSYEDQNGRKSFEGENFCSKTVSKTDLFKSGAPGATRTRGTGIRNPLLYPPELRGHTYSLYILRGFFKRKIERAEYGRGLAAKR